VKTFKCICGNTLHFENSRCLSCDRVLGFVPEQRGLFAIEPVGDGAWRTPGFADSTRRYRKCQNYETYEVCNWLVSEDDPNALCTACRLNEIIPNLQEARHLTLWYRIEAAKRRLIYTLDLLGLPVIGRAIDPAHGLAFRFMADTTPGEFYDEVAAVNRVVTGHTTGIVTINIAEADPSAREQTRELMNESYRTLLGHFRHESGHYYWDRLVRNSPHIDRFRELFGDERGDYAQALERYYADGPGQWHEHYISAYAAAHPWEDWAETWAHFLHIVDTLETAHDYGFTSKGQQVNPVHVELQAGSGYRVTNTFDDLLAGWLILTVTLNDLNRSMGLPDAYPFALRQRAIDKLRFVYQLINKNR